MFGSEFYLNLRKRYLARSRFRVFEFLSNPNGASYDALWKVALSNPLVFESDLKDWLRDNPKILISNLGTGRAPKIGSNHWVRLTT
jgi:hypothetical protein